MPSLPLAVRLELFSDYQSSDLGKRVSDLAWLSQYVPVSPTVVLPVATLEKILISAHGVLQLQTLLKRNKKPETIQADIHRFFDSLQIPKSIVTLVHTEYADYFKRQPVRIQPSSDQFSATVRTAQGEVEVLLAIKRLWSELVFAACKSKTVKNSLAPTGILIQAVPEAKIGGYIASHHIGGLHKSCIVISAGKTRGQIQESAPEQYQVDIRSMAVVVRPTQKQLPRAAKQPQLTLLSDGECRQLTNLAAPAFRQSLQPMAFQWHKTTSGFVFSELLNPNSQKLKHSSALPRAISATKLFVTSNSITKLAAAAPLVDGLGPIYSQYLVHSSGIHPLGALRHPEALAVLKQNIRRSLFELATTKPGAPIFYTLYSANPELRKQLLYSETEEPLASELGNISGSEFLLSFPRWLKFELETLKELITESPMNLQVILPEIKTPEEITRMRTAIRQSGLSSLPSVKIWIEVATPAMVSSLHLFPLENIAGIVLNINHLLPRTTGLTPMQLQDPRRADLGQAIAQDACTLLARQLQTHFATVELSVLVVATHLQPMLARKIVGLGWMGISTTPENVLTVRSAVQAAERLIIEHKL